MTEFYEEEVSVTTVAPPPPPSSLDTEVLVGVDVGGITPIYSTDTPPRGWSGKLRRAAYRIPEHKPSHWLLLLAADRIDVLESRWRQP